MSDECEVEDVDLGWSGTRYALARLSRFKLTVGVHGKDRERKAGESVTNVELAAIHEFGADFTVGGKRIVIPQRSFLRATVDYNDEAIGKELVRVLDDVAALKETPQEALEGTGQMLQGLIQQRIADGLVPELQPATIKRKGSDKPLIASGQLRTSITYVVEEKPDTGEGEGGGDG